MTTTIDVSQTQPPLAELLKQAKSGNEVIFAEGSTPVARLVAIPLAVPRSTRVAGLHRNQISISPDFDEPLPDEFWTGSQ